MPSGLRYRDSSSVDESYRHEYTEDKSTDMSEERDATATGIRFDQTIIAKDELVHEQAADVQPRREPDRELPHQQVHA